ncbi:hypothetical protein [Streptomyces sp. HB2AG]|uniref:hypothetical protein n=1 Tax=Streptomyces sp. HB2AG TaxID=2983400 RepID=UPI0022AA97B7|nr:hypothetical protein [Streptomyces sp. HB2AG]MCZ2527948.1 hypothetical protein [Streptomyces sp. HB2AG]
MAAHARRRTPVRSVLPRTLLGAAVTASSAGALLLTAAGAASAAGPVDAVDAGASVSAAQDAADEAVGQSVPKSAAHSSPQVAAAEGSTLVAPQTGDTVGGLQEDLAAAGSLPVNPLHHGGFNPLDNSVGTRVADLRPVSTADLTGPIAHGASLNDLASDAVGTAGGAAGGLLPG